MPRLPERPGAGVGVGAEHGVWWLHLQLTGESDVSGIGISRRNLLKAGGAGAIAVTAGACSRSGGAPSDQPQPAGAPRYGGTVVLAGGDPGALNPAITSSGQTHPVTGEIFDGLVILDSSFNSRPALARSFRVSEDGRTYTYDLVRTRWHDGTPFTSADVKFSFEEVLVKYHPRTRVALGPILDGVETPDERTAVFRLKSPIPRSRCCRTRTTGPSCPSTSTRAPTR